MDTKTAALFPWLTQSKLDEMESRMRAQRIMSKMGFGFTKSDTSTPANNKTMKVEVKHKESNIGRPFPKLMVSKDCANTILYGIRLDSEGDIVGVNLRTGERLTYIASRFKDFEGSVILSNE